MEERQGRVREHTRHHPSSRGDTPNQLLPRGCECHLRGFATDTKRRRIDGEPVAYLDFQSMFPRLAYVAAGSNLRRGGLYGLVSGIVTQEHRAGIKIVTSAMFYAEGPLSQLPKDAHPASSSTQPNISRTSSFTAGACEPLCCLVLPRC